jgi:hypothetical protein
MTAPKKPSNKENSSSNERPKKKSQRFYQYKLFWALILVVVFYIFLGMANRFINNRDNQVKVANWLYQKTQTKFDFNEVSFNLFWGEAHGKDLNLHVEKTNLKLSLKEFTLRYNPLYLWLGRFKITKIQAKEIWLDTSQLITLKNNNEEKKQTIAKEHIPLFLRRIKLNQARIDSFFWNQSGQRQLSVGKIKLDSKFGSTFYASPLLMTINDIRFSTPKVNLFVNQVQQEGFFIFDFSQPRIFDESKISVKLKVNQALIAIHRKHKPWLNESSWDKDLNNLLTRYYPQEIPKNKTYLFIEEVMLDVEKNDLMTALNLVDINIHGKHIIGSGNLNEHNRKLKLNLKTQKPLDLSKLPLGQSKFRNSFENLAFDINFSGKLNSITKHQLSTKLKLQLLGNLVNPAAGDITADINGVLSNQRFNYQDLNIKIADGELKGSGNLNLPTLITNTNFAATNIDGQTVVRLFSSINIPSKISGKGTITGKVNNPRIAINMTTPNATYEFLNFGTAKGDMLIENKNMKLDVISTSTAIGQSKLKMEAKNIFASIDSIMDVKSDFKNLDITYLLNSPNLSGNISGKFDLKRIKAKVKAAGDFKAKNFAFFEHPIGQVDFIVDVKHKHVDIRPITIAVETPKKTVITHKGISFDFNDLGYKFAGEILESLKLSGSFKKADKSSIDLDFKFNKLNLDIFSSLLPFTVNESTITGSLNSKYKIYDPILSTFKSQIKELDISTPEGKYILNKPTVFTFQNKAFGFRRLDAQIGNGNVMVNGELGITRASNLSIKGDIDFNAIVDFNPFISESEDPVKVDLTFRDNVFLSPKIYGKIFLDGDVVQLRKLTSELDDLQGTLKFDGSKVSSEDLSFNFDDAPVTMTGYIQTNYEIIKGANLKISGKEVPFHPYEGLSLLSDVDITIKGNNRLTMKGDLKVVEGLYHQDFSITNFILRPTDTSLDEESDTLAGLPKNTVYNIKINNTGDFLVKNNLANLEMKVDLNLIGSIEKPELIGHIDFLAGEINAFGISFKDATGFAQFRKGKKNIADVDLSAKNEVQSFTVTASIDGNSENLRLRLNSAPALDRREILSLIFYGQTTTDLTNSNRRNFTQTAAISQLATILADPLEKLSGLDVLKVSSRRETFRQTIQRLSVGKSLSDRFNLSFTTDLDNTDPERAFELGYQLFDNFFLIAAKDLVGGNRYRFDINLRFDAQ